MRFEGKLVRWDDSKGFGFVESMQGGDPIFVHVKAFRQSGARPRIGDMVSFEVEVGPKGKRAKHVERLVVRRHQPSTSYERPAAWGFLSVAAILALLAAYAGVWFLWGISHVWAAYYLVLSVFTAGLYGNDKSAALRKQWRVSEQTLHLCDLLGGWPGGLLAQKALRHKSSKASFQTAFGVCVVLNLAAFVALTHPRFRGLVPWSAV